MEGASDATIQAQSLHESDRASQEYVRPQKLLETTSARMSACRRFTDQTKLRPQAQALEYLGREGRSVSARFEVPKEPLQHDTNCLLSPTEGDRLFCCHPFS
jgi:hypothetical protein